MHEYHALTAHWTQRLSRCRQRLCWMSTRPDILAARACNTCDEGGCRSCRGFATCGLRPGSCGQLPCLYYTMHACMNAPITEKP